MDSAGSVWTVATDADRFSMFVQRPRRRWKLAVGVTTLSVVISVVLAFALPSYWRVEITVMPVTKNGSDLGGLDLGSISGLTRGLSGLGGGIGALLGGVLGNATTYLPERRKPGLPEFRGSVQESLRAAT